MYEGVPPAKGLQVPELPRDGSDSAAFHNNIYRPFVQKHSALFREAVAQSGLIGPEDPNLDQMTLEVMRRYSTRLNSVAAVEEVPTAYAIAESIETVFREHSEKNN